MGADMVREEDRNEEEERRGDTAEENCGDADDDATENTGEASDEDAGYETSDDLRAYTEDDAIEETNDDESGIDGGDDENIAAPVFGGRLPVSLLAGLIGALLGAIPAVASILLFSGVFYPLYAAAPLLMLLFNKLLNGGRDIRATVVTAVFSLASAYMTAYACQAALYASSLDVSIFRIPVITFRVIGRSGILSPLVSSYIYPLVFTALGVFVAAEFLLCGSGSRTDTP